MHRKETIADPNYDEENKLYIYSALHGIPELEIETYMTDSKRLATIGRLTLYPFKRWQT